MSSGVRKGIWRVRRHPSDLLFKLNYLNHILCYFGWADQAARLMMTVSKATRQLWLENLEPILKIIFKDRDYFRNASMQRTFDQKFYDFIMKGKNSRPSHILFTVSIPSLLIWLKFDHNWVTYRAQILLLHMELQCEF